MSTSSSIGARCGRPVGRPYSAASRSRIVRSRLRRRGLPGHLAGRLLPPMAEHRAGRSAGWRRSGAERRRAPRSSTSTACPTAPTLGCRSWSAPAASRPTCPASGARTSPPRSTTRSRATTAGSRRTSTTSGLDRFSLVVHDWGVVGLATAQRLHERLERLVVMAGVPLLPGYEWHRWARIWRTPFAGEMAMGLSTKWARQARYAAAQLIDERVGALRPRHPARDPQALPLGAAGGARARGREPGRHRLPGAGAHARLRPLHRARVRRGLRRGARATPSTAGWRERATGLGSTGPR